MHVVGAGAGNGGQLQTRYGGNQGRMKGGGGKAKAEQADAQRGVHFGAFQMAKFAGQFTTGQLKPSAT
jgi:hypothetical protein